MKTIIPFCLSLVIFIGSVKVSESADLQEAMWAYTAKDYATALREFKPLAEQGHPQAQYYMGVMYALVMGYKRIIFLPICGLISLL